eukprot:6326561-Pyramimonas_sp.AAC.1
MAAASPPTIAPDGQEADTSRLQGQWNEESRPAPSEGGALSARAAQMEVDSSDDAPLVKHEGADRGGDAPMAPVDTFGFSEVGDGFGSDLQ